MFFYNLDILSSPITLYYHGKEKHSSIFSVFFSFIFYIIITLLIIYLFIDFINRKNHSSFYYKSYTEDIGKIEYNESTFFHYLTILSQESYENINNYIIVGYISNTSQYDNETFYKEKDFWLYEKCDDSDDKFYNGKINYTQFNRGLCLKKFYKNSDKKLYSKNNPKFEYPYDLHGSDSEEHLFYVIRAFACFVELNIENFNYDYSKCKLSKSDSLTSDSIALFFSSSFPNLQNFSYPIIGKIYHYQNNIGSFLKVEKTITFHSLKIISDDGIFFHHLKKYYSLVLSNFVQKNFISVNPSTIFIIQLENESDYYERNYIKLFDIFGKLGGTIGMILIIMKEIHKFLYYKFKLLYDFNKLIYYVLEKKKNKNGNNNNSFIQGRNSDKNLFNVSSQNKNPYNNSQIGNNNILRRKSNSDLNMKLKFKYEKNFMMFNKYPKKNYCDYFLYIISCKRKDKNNDYFNQLFFSRTKILSEEKFLSNYVNIEHFKKKFKEICNNKDNINNNNKIANIVKINVNKKHNIYEQLPDSNRALNLKKYSDNDNQF